MDRLKAMRQRDWARLFGFACAAVGFAMSVAGYGGAQWDALILCLGALMLLRAAVEGPSPSRVAGLVRALRVVLFMFAFAAVNRAQGGVEGAVVGVLGNWVLWAVAALLFALPLVRRGLPWGAGGTVWVQPLAIALAVAGFWLVFRWLEPAGDMAALRALVAVAAVANAGPVWAARGQPVVAGVALGLGLVCVLVVPGGAVWPVAAVALPVAVAFGWLWQSRGQSRGNAPRA